jgi:Protein of unknown function (DUF1549)/Protein of unknown function (DUF1553)
MNPMEMAIDSRYLNRAKRLVWFVLSSTVLCAQAVTQVSSDAVVEQIDRLIQESNVGPVAAICSDEDFVRRVSLDLSGLIPSAEATRAFLDDTVADKRAKLILSLIEAPTFARHMAYVFSTHLLERRVDVGTDPGEWLEYLYQSFLQRKPCDQLMREILVADGKSGPDRVRAKFLLDRDSDPAGLVRDIGRIYFGRDVQCAQCHDHPSIADYTQDEYYGLFAFLQRSFLFTDIPNNMTVYVGERAEGLPEYHSIFKKDEPNRLAIPCTPGSQPLPPSMSEPGQDYVVAPGDNIRPIPRKSFRGDLATQATINNAMFDRALANRLWSQMFGRGIVDPIDMHHSDNSPSHPELLDLVANTLRERKYDVGSFLAMIAQTQAYQRAIDPPAKEEIILHRAYAADVIQVESASITALTSQLRALAAEQEAALAPKKEAETKVRGVLQVWLDCQKKFNQLELDVQKLQSSQNELIKTIEAERAKVKVLTEALAKAQEAVTAIPEDPQIKGAATALESRSVEISAALAELVKKSGEQDAAIQSQSAARDLARQELIDATNSARGEYGPLQVAFTRWREIDLHRERLRHRQAVARKRQKMAEALVRTAELQQEIANPPPALQTPPEDVATVAVALNGPVLVDPNANDQLQNAQLIIELERLNGELIEAWTDRFVLAKPRQLSPEQLAWSIRQATGQLALDEKSADDAWIQQNPAPDNLDPTSLAERQERREKSVRSTMIKNLAGLVREFANLFGGGAGQPQWDFHAAADQALFLSNSNSIHQQLNPNGANLAAHLVGISDIQQLAAEAYLHTLSRRPTAEEEKMVQDFVAKYGDQKNAAVHELLWGLLTSVEFRFYR